MSPPKDSLVTIARQASADHEHTWRKRSAATWIAPCQCLHHYQYPLRVLPKVPCSPDPDPDADSDQSPPAALAAQASAQIGVAEWKVYERGTRSAWAQPCWSSDSAGSSRDLSWRCAVRGRRGEARGCVFRCQRAAARRSGGGCTRLGELERC